jgi:hypothetical protein
VEIRPTVEQDRFIRSSSKYPAFVGGFGSGKTEALVLRSIINKIRLPKMDRAFYEPTYDLIRMIAWPRFEEKLEALGIPYRLTRHPHNVLEIEGHGQIIFRSMENPERIIGYEVADSDVDELDTLTRDKAEDVWRRVLSRNRQKKPDGERNTAAVATTPEGFRFVYDRWELNPPEGYSIVRASTRSNPHLPEDYIQSLTDTYPDHLLEAYLEGRFVNLTSGTVYREFDRRKHATNEIAGADEPLHIGMDFNVGQMAAVVHVERGGSPRAVDEIVDAYDTPDMCRIIRDLFGQDRTITIYPDASGDSRRSVNASKTDITILHEHKFRVVAPKKNPPVRDRINCMNASFKRGDYLVNPDRCPTYVRCLEQQAYDRHGGPDKTQGLDHHTDAAGYYMHQRNPLTKPATSTRLRMVF